LRFIDTSRRFARRLLLPALTDYSSHEWVNLRPSFSQFGEDLGLLHLLGNAAEVGGVYVDVGAYDPIYLSNTYALYRLGWSGLIVDANPAVIDRYRAVRPRDSAVNAFVSPKKGSVDFTVFDADMFSTLTSLVDAVPEKWRKGERSLNVRAAGLSELLEAAGVMDFQVLNVDAEGGDLDVLQSLDWDRWRPRIVCCEDHGDAWMDSPISRFLGKKGYCLCGRYGVSSLYKARDSRVLQPNDESS
jgi:FkbM family methyltransferase